MREKGATGPNVAVVRGFYDALSRGDVTAMLGFLDPRVVWRTPESVPWGGTFHGHKGFREFIRKLYDQPAELRRESREYVDVDDRVVVLLRPVSQRDNDPSDYDIPRSQVWTVRSGKVIHFVGHFDPATVLSAGTSAKKK